MNYRTNQVCPQTLFTPEHYTNIGRDFFVYRFELGEEEKSYGHSLIDEVKQQLPGIKAVVHLWGKTFYALFDKNSFRDHFELQQHIAKLVKSSGEVIYNRVKNLQNTNEINPRTLAQLLFNSLAGEQGLSNITGKLYWVVKGNNNKKKFGASKGFTWQYKTLEIQLDKDFHLALDVATFTNLLLVAKKVNFSKRKKKLKDYPQYEITDDEFRSMRRIKDSARIYPEKSMEGGQLSASKKAKMVHTFINIQVDGERNTVDFLDFSTFTKFEQSKSGVLYLFLEEVKKHLHPYLNIRFKEIAFSDDKTGVCKETNGQVENRLAAFYQNRPLVIDLADSLKNDEKALKLAQNLQLFLTDPERGYKVPEVTIGDMRKDALNLRIVQEKEAYREGEKDEYYRGGDLLVSHITPTNFDLKMEKKNRKGEMMTAVKSPALDVVLSDSYIKNDIRQGTISLVDWQYGEWIFMQRERERDEQGKTMRGKDRKFAYHALRVRGDGSLEYAHCPVEGMFGNYELDSHKNMYERHARGMHYSFGSWLVVHNGQHRNLIADTSLFTLQNMEEIAENLLLSENDTQIEKDTLLKMLKTFGLEYLKSRGNTRKDRQHAEGFRAMLALIEDSQLTVYSKEDLNRLFEEHGFSNNNGLKKAFLAFYQRHSEAFLGKKDILYSILRGKAPKEALLGSRLDIFYHQHENGREGYYCVGEKSEGIPQGFAHAANIRKVTALPGAGGQSQLVFDRLLPALAVHFVRQGRYTVLPFPFKYLREMAKASGSNLVAG